MLWRTMATGGLRKACAAFALVVALVSCLILETGHPAEAADLSASAAVAAAVHHYPGDQPPADAPWHVEHCGVHCAGHAIPEPSAAPLPFLAPAPELWHVVSTRHLTSRAPPVQDRPPRA